MLRDVSDEDRAKPMTAPPAQVDRGRYTGPANASPYPMSRLAPAYTLVDAAAQIQAADQTLALMTGGKLGVIADQIQRLQEQARALLECARRDAELHRAECRFEKKPGDVLHLYCRDGDDSRWLSRLAPDEWVTPQAQTFEGSYRLELDMSFTRIDVAEPEVSSRVAVPLLAR